MKKGHFKFQIVLLLLLGLSFKHGSLQAQDLKKKALESLQSRPEFFVTLPLHKLKGKDPSELPGFGGISGDSVNLYLRLTDTSFIRKNSHILNLSTPPSMRVPLKNASSFEEVLAGEAYPSYPLFLEILEYFQNTYKGLCRIDTIGATPGDHLVLGARLSNSGSPDTYPVLMYTSTIHGDETAGFMMMLLLINEILENQNSLPYSQLLGNSTLIIVPLENPDGCYYGSDQSIYGAIRYNLNGVDLNRNYPDPEDGPNPDGNQTQPEVTHMMNYLNTWKPNLSANFHGGTEVVNYPFDTWEELHADDEWFRFISREYADTAQNKLAGYMRGFDNGITNGYQWYTISGGRQDYVTYFLQGRETTIELSDQKTVSIDRLKQLWNANKTSMINYLLQGLYGIHGYVSDSLTGTALEAEISLPGYDKLGSQVYSRPESGVFFRYLKQGNYNFRINASGYRPLFTENVLVTDYAKKNLEIKLLPSDYSPDEFTYSLSPVPFESELKIEIESPEETDLLISFFNLQGMRIYHGFRTLVPGYNLLTLQPPIRQGSYILKLEYQGRAYLEMIVKTGN